MANINVRREEQGKAMTTGSPEWEPSRMIRQFFGWDPFREMAPLMRGDLSTFMPAFEVKETKEGYTFKADVPGVKESDLDVTLSKNRLTVSGKRDAEKQERTDTYYAFERSFGSFTRSFTVPDDVEASGIHADLRDGVLTLFVPRKPEAQPQKIAVKSGPTGPKA
jgi:HSP20 family protein